MSEDRAAFAGEIADVSVIELLRTILHGAHTGEARFSTPSGDGTLWFRDGALVDADMGRYHMEAAVSRLIALDAGHFEVEFKPIARRQVIALSTAELIAQATTGGVPVHVPPSASDTSARRTRRVGLSWQPTAGGQAKSTSSAPAGTDAANPPTISPPGAVAARRPAFSGAPQVDPLPPPPPTSRVGDEDKTLFRPRAADSQSALPGVPDPEDRTTLFTGSAPLPVRREAWAAPPPRASSVAPSLPAGPAVATASGSILAEVAPSAPPFPPPRTPGPSPPTMLLGSPGAPVAAPVRRPSVPSLPRPMGLAPAAITAPAATQPVQARDSGQHPVAGRSPSDEVRLVDATLTAGSLTRPRPSSPSRPGQARAAAVAQAIGMQAANPIPERRPVSDGYRLDQQVEAARAAGLTGASAPAVVGRYEVLLRIARGGMGTVYLARVTGEGGFRRLFALKVLRDHLSQNEEYVRMLLQEARIASRLHHPNVVGILDIGTLANQHYLVMDYVEGCTLSELLKVHRRSRPPQLLVPILIDALTGLEAAHRLVDDDGSPLTLVHCDFSPQNMLVGANGVCRITDFGIARAADALHDRSNISRGKPAYVSPEQVTGQALDHRSDVFSAGVVLWNALTGEQLFRGDTPEETLNQVLQRPIPLPSTVGLRPPRCFDPVCLRALARDPAARYQSAEEMLMDLRRIAIREDFLAPPSDVARWVVDTFGRQLELRRQAAGISSRPLGPDSQPIPVTSAAAEQPVLGFAEPELTAETRLLPPDYAQTPTPAGGPSGETPAVETIAPQPHRSRLQPIAIAAAAMVATTTIAIAIARPEWLRGGAVDQTGEFHHTLRQPDPPNKAPGPRAKPTPDGASVVGPDAPTMPEAPTGGASGPAPRSPAEAVPVDPTKMRQAGPAQTLGRSPRILPPSPPRSPTASQSHKAAVPAPARPTTPPTAPTASNRPAQTPSGADQASATAGAAKSGQAPNPDSTDTVVVED